MGIERALLRVANRAFDLGKVLRGNIDACTTEECVIYWSILDLLEKKLVEGRKKALRQRLLDAAAELGDAAKNGSRVLKLSQIGAEVKLERRGGAITYNMLAAEDYVSANGERHPSAKNLITYKPVINEEALVGLRKAEMMSQEEYDSIVCVGPPSSVLKVKKPRELAELAKEYEVG